MLANNLAALVEHCWDKQSLSFQLDLTREILSRSIVTHAGEIRNETISRAYGSIRCRVDRRLLQNIPFP